MDDIKQVPWIKKSDYWVIEQGNLAGYVFENGNAKLWQKSYDLIFSSARANIKFNSVECAMTFIEGLIYAKVSGCYSVRS